MIHIYLDNKKYLRLCFNRRAFITYHHPDVQIQHSLFSYNLTQERYDTLLSWFERTYQKRKIIIYSNNKFETIRSKRKFKEYIFLELLKSE